MNLSLNILGGKIAPIMAMKLMLRRSILLPALLFGAIAVSPGCLSFQSAYTVESRDDAARGYSLRRLTNNFLGGSYRVPGSLKYSAQLNPQKVVLVEQTPSGPVKKAHYSLVARLRELSPVDIRAGASLEIIADGRKFTYSGKGSVPFRKREARGSGQPPLILEAAYWHQVPAEDLRAMSRARSVTVIIRGDKRDLNLFFTDKNYSNFRRFVSEHVD